MNSEDRLGELLTDEDAHSVKTAELEGQPDLVRAVEAWNAMRSDIRRQLETSWPGDRELLLCALDASGHGSDLTAEERDLVKEIRPSFEAALNEHQSLNDIVADVGRDRDAFEAIWEARQRPRIVRIPPMIWRIAAVVALVGLIGVLALTLMQRTGNWEVVSVAASEMEQMTLPDGSTVHLVGPAEIRYGADEFDRTVQLTGGAFFDVVDRPDRFVVRTDEAMTSVLGTRFGVLDRDGSTEVTVESGRVEVALEGAMAPSVILSPGQTSRVATDSAPTQPEEQDLAQALAWTGMLFFRATPMAEVAELLTARYGIVVSVDDSLAAEQVTGSFAADDALDHVLRTLAIPIEASASLSETGWHVGPR